MSKDGYYGDFEDRSEEERAYRKWEEEQQYQEDEQDQAEYEQKHYDEQSDDLPF